MGGLVTFPPSSSMLLPQLHTSKQTQLPISCRRLSLTSPMCFISTKQKKLSLTKHCGWRTRCGIISDMSLSQELTLGFASLVGVGGVIGYLKSGSSKSLAAGGVSVALLYYVYSILPSDPILASSVGLGISASLMGVMGYRLKKTEKIFPAGFVLFVSLVMGAGYLHGILRSLQ